MKTIRQFALVLMVVLPLLIPNMVCALPNAHLTPTEHACCKQMNGQCGTMKMSVPCSCCQKEVPTVTNWNAAVQTRSANVPIDFAAPVALLPAMLMPAPVDMPVYAQQPASTLPQSPPSAISILRI